jgi:vacuolar-type H+-ATPase subunit I/STV1
MFENNFNTEIYKENQFIIDICKEYKYIDNINYKINNQEDEYNNNINQVNNIIIDNFSEEYKNKLALEILQKELSIIKLLSKYSLQTNNLDFSFVTKCLKLCLTLSEILRKKIGQKKIVINNQKNNIQRCSYKFCNFKENCTYNYGKKKNYCYQDHFVHNMVSYDLDMLIKYINSYNFKNLKKNDYLKEILKSINTLSYVINHMENELKAKCLYQEKTKWDSYHVYNAYKK